MKNPDRTPITITEQDLSSFATQTGKLCRDDKILINSSNIVPPYVHYSTEYYPRTYPQ